MHQNKNEINDFEGGIFDDNVNEHISGMSTDSNAIDAVTGNIINEGSGTSLADMFPGIDISPINVCHAFGGGVKLDGIDDDDEPDIIQDPAAALDYYETQPPLVSPYHGLFYNGELAVLFGAANVGKTSFALHILEYIAARTKRLAMFYDIETSDRSFYARCMVDGEKHVFPKNFKRISSAKRDMEAVTSIANIANQLHPSIIVVDNLTALRSEQEDAASAKELILSLKDIAHSTGTTILLLAHTTKNKEGQILRLSDIRGSGVIGDLVDSAFCICRSRQGELTRVIKHVRSRNGMLTTVEDFVIVAQMSAADGMLKVVPEDAEGNLNYDRESAHISLVPFETEKDEKRSIVLSGLQEGNNIQQISDASGIPYNTVKRIAKRLKDDGMLFSATEQTSE